MTDRAAPNPADKRRILLKRLTFTLAVAGLGWGAYWFQALSHHEATDNAYVGGNLVPVNAQVAGTVTTVAVDSTDWVKAGETVVRLDPADAELALERAKAELAQAVRESKSRMAGNDQLAAQLAAQRAALARAEGDLTRREALGRLGGIAAEELQHARDNVVAVRAAVAAAGQALRANQVLVLSGSAQQQPAVARAAAQLRSSYLALKRSDIVSPVAGLIARRTVQLGSQVAAGTPLMAVVPMHEMWVDANFKETQLKNMRIGQPVELEADLYGGSVTYRGRVAGMAAGTGSVFSLLPAQNATGNWIKVVQRVPVRIALDPKQLAEHPLRLGLSMSAEVDTADTSGPVLTTASRSKPAFVSTVYDDPLKEVDRIVADIVSANLGRARER
ncbi:HlyD family efflux transporter periplasmic adaptor subunit [Crenobacter cavernae]|uniref:HlyD family efflux transporter periplasmic adaptor subunit n=1 Tax=Crenobacter cavernae TaxID=2290923 RepID=A0ABY0FGB5_9NEIS|nr:HlyD family efflux transporter periplasmic adaptor subunit [Crenobacter cavernae]RXZ45444.1 HlyD family efflux transporter periplasmic adaptor subunit [Crenobacter cavernae]